MSFQITTAFVTQFSANVMHLAQQMGSRLAGTTLEDTIVGEKAFWEQVGLASLIEKTARHMDTPHTEIPHARRMVVTKDYLGNEYIDKEDQVKLLIEPSSEYAQAFAMAVGRLRDDVIIAAATADAFTGKDGTTTTSFDSTNNLVAVDYGSVGNSNLTVKKVKEANRILNYWDVEENDRFAVIDSDMLAALQDDDEFTSRDYNVLMPLMDGQVPNVAWMGFIWRRSERLPFISGSTTIKNALFYQKKGIKVGIGRGPVFRISERADKNYATQVHVAVSWGGTRMEEHRVVAVRVDESA